jgi:hypothetical protein
LTAPRRPQDDWNQLKPDTTIATKELVEQLQGGASTQDLLDTYLYAKRLLAESMQAFIRIGLPERCEEFHQLRDQLAHEMQRWYGGRIPDSYLTVPYGSRVHEELFSVLLQRKGVDVEAALLRVVTADSVHTERRVRELRELGMDITSHQVNETDYYVLRSLELDHRLINSIIKNTAKRKKYRAMPKKKLFAVLGEDED